MKPRRKINVCLLMIKFRIIALHVQMHMLKCMKFYVSRLNVLGAGDLTGIVRSVPFIHFYTPTDW